MSIENPTPHERAIEHSINGHQEEDRERLRRNAVTHLSLDLLQKLNPAMNPPRIEELFFAHGDILKTPFKEIRGGMINTATGELRGWEDALKIAQYYWNSRNEGTPVPAKVIVVTDGKTVDRQRTSGQKELLYIDAGYNRLMQFRKDSRIRVQEKIKRGWFEPEEEAELPDAYISDVIGTEWKGLKELKMRGFTIKGVDNLLIGGDINTGEATLELEAKNRIVLLPGASLSSQNSAAYMKAEGSIYQYDGVVALMNITGEGDYYQYEGGIGRPKGNAQQTVNMSLTGEYKYLGGKRPDPLTVSIHDSNYGRIAEQAVATIATKEGLEQKQEQKTEVSITPQPEPPQTQPTSREKKLVNEETKEPTILHGDEAKFRSEFEEYKPELTINRKENDGSTTIFQTHILEVRDNGEDMRTYADFITLALAAGFQVDHERSIGLSSYKSKLVITLKRNEVNLPEKNE